MTARAERFSTHCVAWAPDWGGIFGGLKPYYYADVHPFFHDLDQLPAGM